MLSRRHLRAGSLMVLAASLSSLLITGCLSFSILRKHPEFTSESQLEIVPGLAPEEIEKRYGPPDRTAIQMRGTKTDRPWQALVYEYVMGPHPDGKYEYSDNINSFVFSVDDGFLQYWEIQLAYAVDTTKTQDASTVREIIFHDGIYIGETKRGLPHGQGKYSYTSGLVYEGDWVMGKRTGTGTNYYSSGEKYSGQFLDGRPSGGLYFFRDGTSERAYMDESREWKLLD